MIELKLSKTLLKEAQLNFRFNHQMSNAQLLVAGLFSLLSQSTARLATVERRFGVEVDLILIVDSD